MSVKQFGIMVVLAVIVGGLGSFVLYQRVALQGETASAELETVMPLTEDIFDAASFSSTTANGIVTTSTAVAEQETNLGINCGDFPERLTSCTEYQCQFIHPLSGETMSREIQGIIDGKCVYIEEMNNGMQMECRYSESFRKAVAQYYSDIEYAESLEFEINLDLGSDELATKYWIDGEEVGDPLQEALDTGVCFVSGY